MDNRVKPAALQPVHHLRRRHDIGELAFGEVAPFAVMAEHVAHSDVGAARVIERGHDIRPDKTGATGHQQHDAPCPDLWKASFASLRCGRQLGSCGLVKTAATPLARLYLRAGSGYATGLKWTDA